MYFKPYINHLSYAAQENESNDNLVSKTLCPDWDSGYRLFLGYESDGCVNWGVNGSYTYFGCHDSGFVNANQGDLYPVRFLPFLFQALSFGYENLELDIDILTSDASYDLKYHH